MMFEFSLTLLHFNWFSFRILTYCTIFYWSHEIQASSNNINTKYPFKRNFIPLPGTYALNPNNDPVTFRVLQLNVLADGLSGRRPDLGYFSRITSPDVLDWHSRKTKLLHEITQYRPDVITMQEVDHYYDFFLPEMNKLGYSGYFAPKPTSACLDNLQPLNSTADGCVLFIKRKKFKVISCETKTLALSVAGLSEGELLEDDLNIKAQNQVALFAVCEFNAGDENDDEYDDETNITTNNRNNNNKNNQSASNNGNDNSNSRFNLFGNNNDNTPFRPKPPPPLLICTTHLKSAKTTVGELYRQKAILQVLDKVENLYCKFADTGRTPAVLLTGDFNAVPEIAPYAPPLTYEAVKMHSLLFRSIYNDDAKFSLFPLSNNPLYTTWKARNLPPGVDSQFPGNQMMIPRNWTTEDWTTNFMAVAARGVISDSDNSGFSSTGYGSLFGPYKANSNNTENGNSKNNNNSKNSNNGKNGTDVEESVVKRCIDYIFYCPFISKNIKISDALRIKDEEEVSRLLGEDVIDEEMEFYSTGDYLSSSSSASSSSSKVKSALTSSDFNSDGMLSSGISNGLEDRDEIIFSDEEEEDEDDEEVDDIEENDNDEIDIENNSDDTAYDEIRSKKKKKRRKKMKDKLMVGHPTTVFSTEQVTLSLSLRYVVYFLNSLLPITALVYSDMPLNEILQVTGMALFGLFCFEYMMAVKPTPFNPVIPSQIKIDIENVAVLPTTAGRRISRQKLVNKATAMGKNMLTRSGLYLTGRPGLQPVALLDIFTDEEVGDELFPSVRYPSDHLAIAADFQLLWDKNEEYSSSSNNDKWDDDGSGGDGGSNNNGEGNDSGMVSNWNSVDEFNGSSSSGDDSSNNFDRKQQ